MFFDGGPSPDVCCTILLRGGPTSELSKLKKIMSFIVLAEYNWRLEKSFLMDEFARPPSPPADLFQDSPSGSPVSNKLGHNILTANISLSGRVPLKSYHNVQSSSPEVATKNSADSEKGFPEVDDVRVIHSDKKETPLAANPSEKTNSTPIPVTDNFTRMSESFSPVQSEECSDQNFSLQSEVVNDHNASLQSEAVRDQSDPLQAVWAAPVDTVQLSVAELPRGNKFRTALDDIFLSISPFLKVTVPYLESDVGRNCPLRSYFPNDIFYSKQFLEKKQEKEARSAIKCEEFEKSSHILLPKHEFLSTKLTDDASSSNVQTLLALYRASGGQIPLGATGQVRKKQPVAEMPKPRDVLDPFEHQQFSVLFCSYSGHSENAPAFCVDPW